MLFANPADETAAMTESPRRRSLFVLAILIGILPFGFALFRAVSTGTDFRMLWMALAALLGATAVMALGKARSQPRNVVLILTAIAFAVGTLLAALTAILLGATAAFGIWAVAVVLAGCCAVSQWLATLSRSPAV